MKQTVYLDSYNIATIALCASFWGILNSVFSPIFFRITGLPFLCDFTGFATLIIAAWWTRKFGIITAIGLVATAINFIFNPGGIHFLGFLASSFLFDSLISIIGYRNSNGGQIRLILTFIPISIISAAFAGYLIGLFFLPYQTMASWGGAIGWAGLHALGGVIGGIIGVSLVLALDSRKIQKSKISG
jgi:hypothetical protein